jgi:hypothetical protein
MMGTVDVVGSLGKPSLTRFFREGLPVNQELCALQERWGYSD